MRILLQHLAWSMCSVLGRNSPIYSPGSEYMPWQASRSYKCTQFYTFSLLITKTNLQKPFHPVTHDDGKTRRSQGHNQTFALLLWWKSEFLGPKQSDTKYCVSKSTLSPKWCSWEGKGRRGKQNSYPEWVIISIQGKRKSLPWLKEFSVTYSSPLPWVWSFRDHYCSQVDNPKRKK